MDAGKRRSKKIDEPSPETLAGELYRVYTTEGVLSDKQWADLYQHLLLTSIRAVRKAKGPYKIPKRTRDDLAEEVRLLIFQKFLKKSLGDTAAIRNFEALIKVTAFHSTVSALRKIKSVLPGHLESDPSRAEVLQPDYGDVFLEIRSHLPPFRFPAHLVVRDCLLSYRLATNGYPKMDWIMPFVAASQRALVFNAAIVDINVTLEGSKNAA